jgi:hypothetical protein
LVGKARDWHYDYSIENKGDEKRNMSVQASIQWTIHPYPDSMVTVIQLMLAHGWTINDYGKMGFLPVHDDDMFDWQREEINADKLMEIINEKNRLNERLGVSITWKESNIGGQLLTYGADEIGLVITINRQIVPLRDGVTMTDVNWYLERIKPIFILKNGVTISSIKFSEIY